MSAEHQGVSADLFEAGRTIELVCVGGFDPIRSRIPPRGITVIVRTGMSTVRPVSGEIFALEIERSWIFGHTRYVKGLVTASRLDVERLELEPLRIEEGGPWDPEDEGWLFEEPEHPLYEQIRAAGERPTFEMEQILPEDAVELRWEEDPIVEAAELAAAGAVGEAVEILEELLAVDLRCLDAHAHLGNFESRSRWPGALDRAERHYRVGVAIGELTLGADFQGLLPWGLIDNRPFLRCLHGFGLCLWRRNDLSAAAEVFRRMLWLNPDDNQGASFLLATVEEGRSWEEVVAEEERADGPGW